MLKAINIKWDTDGDEEVLQDLPTEMIVPDDTELVDLYNKDREYAIEEISDWLSDEVGFCNNGFELVKENTPESVESELFDFFINEINEDSDIERVRVFKDYLVTADNGIIIDCSNAQHIRLTIQVD